MSEQAHFTSANDRLKNWDANKAANEAKQYEAALYGDAGVSDFSDEARRRLGEAGDYEAHLANMAERGAEYDPLTATLDQAENGEYGDAIDRTIQADPKLRRMQRMAKDVAELNSAAVTPENDRAYARQVKDKEDKLQDLLVAFSETSALPDSEKDDIIRRIIDQTEGTPSVAEEVNAPDVPKEVNTPKGPGIKNVIAARGESAQKAPETADKPDSKKEEPTPSAEQTEVPEAPAVGFDSRAAVDEAKERLATQAADKAAEATDSLRNNEQARADRELLSPVSTEGLEDDEQATDETLAPVSTEGLEDDAAEAEEHNEEAAPEEVQKKRRLARAWKSFSNAFDRASYELGAVMTKVSYKLAKRGGKKEGESDEAYEARQRKYGRRAVLGIVAVAGASLALKLGTDVDTAHAQTGGGIDRSSSNDLAELLDIKTGKTEAADAAVYPNAATRVGNGEGWYQTFKEMGIPKEKWNTLLDEVGPKLTKMGEGYRAPSLGGYGIKGDGRLSEQALNLIADSAKRIK